MDRNTKLLQGLDLSADGIEIGPSFAPLAPKSAGFRTTVVDHASRSELVSKYKGHSVDTSRIEEVDVVWKAGTLAEAVQRRGEFHWILASHVIEHVPDLIGFLNDCDEVLNDRGILSLAVPDRRYCFDYYRPPSSLSSVIDAHVAHHNKRMRTPGTVAEHFLNAVLSDNAIAWSRGRMGALSFAHQPAQARELMEVAMSSSEYIDCHAWVFTPSVFRLLVADLNTLGFIRLRETQFYDSQGCEFIIGLSRKGEGSGLDRIDLLERVRREASD